MDTQFVSYPTFIKCFFFLIVYFTIIGTYDAYMTEEQYVPEITIKYPENPVEVEDDLTSQEVVVEEKGWIEQHIIDPIKGFFGWIGSGISAVAGSFTWLTNIINAIWGFISQIFGILWKGLTFDIALPTSVDPALIANLQPFYTIMRIVVAIPVDVTFVIVVIELINSLIELVTSVIPFMGK